MASGRRGKQIEFAGRSNKCQRFAQISFPGECVEGWDAGTSGQCTKEKKKQLANACVFFPDASSDFYGVHSKPCKCLQLYKDCPDFPSWPDGKAPFGCKWFNKWCHNLEDVIDFEQVGVVVYKPEKLNDPIGGLGHSQKGEVKEAEARQVPIVRVDADEFKRLVEPLSNSPELFDGMKPEDVKWVLEKILQDDRDEIAKLEKLERIFFQNEADGDAAETSAKRVLKLADEVAARMLRAAASFGAGFPLQRHGPDHLASAALTAATLLAAEQSAAEILVDAKARASELCAKKQLLEKENEKVQAYMVSLAKGLHLPVWGSADSYGKLSLHVRGAADAKCEWKKRAGSGSWEPIPRWNVSFSNGTWSAKFLSPGQYKVTAGGRSLVMSTSSAFSQVRARAAAEDTLPLPCYCTQRCWATTSGSYVHLHVRGPAGAACGFELRTSGQSLPPPVSFSEGVWSVGPCLLPGPNSGVQVSINGRLFATSTLEAALALTEADLCKRCRGTGEHLANAGVPLGVKAALEHLGLRTQSLGTA